MLEAIEGLALSEALRRSVYVYPLVNALHILALGVLVTSALLMDARLLGLGRRLALPDVITALRPIAIGSLVLAVLSGALLFIVRPLAYAANPVFLTKLVLVVLAVANAAAFTLLRRDERPTAALTLTMALASITLWLATLTTGRLIAFFGGE